MHACRAVPRTTAYDGLVNQEPRQLPVAQTATREWCPGKPRNTDLSQPQSRIPIGRLKPEEPGARIKTNTKTFEFEFGSNEDHSLSALRPIFRHEGVLCTKNGTTNKQLNAF